MKDSFASSPAQSYDEALLRIRALQSLDTEAIDPLAHTSFLTHGARAARAMLLLHGFTATPHQYARLADEFFRRGYNVFVPRFPHHGLKERMTEDTAKQTGQELLAFTTEAVDIARGLGEDVTVAGLSMGGVLALWVGMQRRDVALACAISPALAFRAVPLALTGAVTRAFLLLPNRFRWWDESTKDAPVPPLQGYPRYATRGLAHVSTIGLKLRAQARTNRPAAGAVLVITNPSDESVDNSYAREMVASWTALGASNVRHYEFEARHNLIHDLIDPDQPRQQVDVVYPILLELIDG